MLMSKDAASEQGIESTAMNYKAIRDQMIEAHIPFIEDAASQGVQVLCFQEVFTQPYFCPSQDRKWYAAAEKVPDGHTTKLMQEYAKKHGMVIVVAADPLYLQHGSQPWRYEKENLNLVGDFIAWLPGF